MEASAKLIGHPRAHAWESPRSWAQGFTLVLVVYIVAVSVFCTTPVLFDIVHVASPSYVRTIQYATMLSQWSPVPGVLAVVVLSCYLVVSFKDPGSGQPLLETNADRDCVPICAHCNWPLSPETNDMEAVTHFTCKCCGAMAYGTSDGLIGLWSYGLYGSNEIEIQSHPSGYYEILDGYNRALLRRLSASIDEEKEDTYEADWSNETKIRIVMLGHNALRISLSSTSLYDWKPFAVARRKVGGGVLGEWSIPVWDYNTLDIHKANPMPDCWQCFEVTSMPGAQDIIIKEERNCSRTHGLAVGVQDSLEPHEVAQGLLRLDISVLEGVEGTPDYVAQQNLVAQLHTEQGKKACGWVRLKVESDHLIYQYRPEESDLDDWGPQLVAVRGGTLSVACCERCGLASQPPSPASRYNTGHCNYCNKCIPGFDHHCIFLNQCVGQRNYKEWLLLIVSLLAMGVEALLGALLVLFASRSSPLLQNPWPWILAEVGVVIGSIVLDVFLFQLVAFHFWLMLKKRTTAGTVFKTTADAAYERRRAKHMWRICQSVAKRRCLPLPPPPPAVSLSLPGTPNAFARPSQLSPSLPGTPGAFARPSPLSPSLPGTPGAFARPSPLSPSLPGTPNAFANAFTWKVEESEVESEHLSCCGSPQRSVDVVTARAICAGTTLDSADEDFSGPFLELRRGKSDLLDGSPGRACLLSSPLLRNGDPMSPFCATPTSLHKRTRTSPGSLEVGKDDSESPANKDLSFLWPSVPEGQSL